MNAKRSFRMSPKSVGSSKPTTVLPKQGMTLLGFLGRGSNSRPFYGATQRYEFGGKHHMMGNVWDSDVVLFLGMKENGKPLFERVKVVKAEKVAKVEPVVEPEPVITPTLADLDKAVKPVKKSKKKKPSEPV